MLVIYEEYGADLWKFIRLNFDTGEYDIKVLKFDDAKRYIAEWRKLGYTFIHR